MTEDERGLWERYREGDETARRALLLRYLPLVEVHAGHIARSAGWADWRDLKQDGVSGLMQAMKRFDPSRDVAFASFARPYIRGAIFDSRDLTRNLARRQQEIFRQVREADAEMTRTLGRQPTMAEVAEKTGLSDEQIRNAIAAVGVAFAAAPADADQATAVTEDSTAQLEASILVREMLARLGEREAQIIIYYYMEGRSSQEISEQLGLTVSNVTKIRQRALGKLRDLFGDEGGGGHDENG
ncbi:MAG TPA: sigma-70 family RNA polymerase sigma factor [Blastocatellia bacterium]